MRCAWVHIGFPKIEEEWLDCMRQYHQSDIKKIDGASLDAILLMIGKIQYIGMEEITRKVRSVFALARKYSTRVYLKYHRSKQSHLLCQKSWKSTTGIFLVRLCPKVAGALVLLQSAK